MSTKETKKTEVKEIVKTKETKKPMESKETKTPSQVEGMLNIKPITPTYTALKFESLQDITKIIQFTGQPPVINGDLSLKIGRFTVNVGDFIIRHNTKVIDVVKNIDSYTILTKPE